MHQQLNPPRFRLHTLGFMPDVSGIRMGANQKLRLAQPRSREPNSSFQKLLSTIAMYTVPFNWAHVSCSANTDSHTSTTRLHRRCFARCGAKSRARHIGPSHILTMAAWRIRLRYGKKSSGVGCTQPTPQTFSCCAMGYCSQCCPFGPNRYVSCMINEQPLSCIIVWSTCELPPKPSIAANTSPRGHSTVAPAGCPNISR